MFSTILSPLDQFEIRNLFSVDTPLLGNINISLTNIVLYLTISFLIIVTLSSITNRSRKLVYNNWTLTKETLYDTVYGIVTSQINK